MPAVFALALAGYRAGMAPGLLWGDSAEMQTLAAVGGVAHPTGYPLFTLLAQVLTHLVHLEPAHLANLFSALFAAATLALLTAFLIARGVSGTASFAASLALGLSFTFWTTSHRAEVYSLAMFVALAGLWCTLSSLEKGGRSTRLAAGLLLGLTLSGHMAFAPFVMVAGLALAWRVPRAGARWLADELALLAAFALGHTPYLYLVWADMHRVGLDYMHLFDIVQWPDQPVPEEFRSPWKRVWWLLTSRNLYPPVPLDLHWRMLAKNVYDTGCHLFLFELGPVTMALVAIGARARWRGPHKRETAFLAALAIATIVFSMLTSGYKILAVFLLPCFLVCAVFAGHGLDESRRRLTQGAFRWLATPLVLLLPLAGSAISQTVRLATYDHPVWPFRSRVIEEDDIRQRGFLPTLYGYDEPRRFVESAAARLPDSALVVTEWREGTALFYLQLVERRRTDLTLQPSGYPMLLTKVANWQRKYPPRERPVVVIGPYKQMSTHFDRVDTLRLATGQAVWVTRTPLVRLDRPAGR